MELLRCVECCRVKLCNVQDVGCWRYGATKLVRNFPFHLEGSGSFGHLGEPLLPFLLPRSTLVTFLPIVIAS